MFHFGYHTYCNSKGLSSLNTYGDVLLYPVTRILDFVSLSAGRDLGAGKFQGGQVVTTPQYKESHSTLFVPQTH